MQQTRHTDARNNSPSIIFPRFSFRWRSFCVEWTSFSMWTCFYPTSNIYSIYTYFALQIALVTGFLSFCRWACLLKTDFLMKTSWNSKSYRIQDWCQTQSYMTDPLRTSYRDCKLPKGTPNVFDWLHLFWLTLTFSIEFNVFGWLQLFWLLMYTYWSALAYVFYCKMIFNA